MSYEGKPVSIIMIEDDEGHARLIEKNVRRAGVNNPITPFTNGTDALNYLLGPDGSGEASARRHLLILLDLNLIEHGSTDHASSNLAVLKPHVSYCCSEPRVCAEGERAALERTAFKDHVLIG